MSTPNHGLPFPVLGDVPNVPADIQALAEAIDAALPSRVQSGTASIAAGTCNPTGSGTTTATVVFPRPYAAPPAVVLGRSSNPGTAFKIVERPGSITATGFTVSVYNMHDTDVISYGAFTVNWVAVGAPA